MGIVDEFFQGFQNLLDNNWEGFIHYFDTPFFHMVGYTGVAALGCTAFAYFFPQLRAFAGAVFFSLGAMWYGFYQGTHSKWPKRRS